MWGLGVMLVNSYVDYIAANTIIWKKDKKQLVSYYEFRKAVALALIVPEKLDCEEEQDSDNRFDDSTSAARSVERPRKKKVAFVTTRSNSKKTLTRHVA